MKVRTGLAEEFDGHDRSADPTVVEYAVRFLFKGKSIPMAAKATAQKLSGGENMFLGPGVTKIDAKRLETALWHRLSDLVIKGLSRVKPGFEHMVLDGILQQFRQPLTLRKELKARVVASLGHDPFGNEA